MATESEDGMIETGAAPLDDRPDPQDLDDRQAADEIADLSAQLAQANDEYHTNDAPVLSDAEYDALKRRLQALEQAFPQLASPDSPTQKIGGAVAEGFGKITHAQRMMSLENEIGRASCRERV